MRKRMSRLVIGALMLTLVSGTAAFAAESADKDPAKTAGGQELTITMEDAVEIALNDAEVRESDAAIYKRIWEYGDNTAKYEIDFVVPGQVKYEYDIEVATGRILENDKENWEADDDMEYSGLTPGRTVDPEEAQKALAAAEETAFKDAGVTADDVIVYKRGTDLENGKEVYVVEFFQDGKAKFEYDIAAADGTIVTREQEPWEKEDDLEYKYLLHPEEAAEEQKAAETTGGITNDEAQEIALKDAGLTENDVNVTKCRIDVDDGVEKYEVEFRTADGVEYEYEIDVLTGKILDRDVERDDD